MKQTLLIELLTEELPPKALQSLGLTFRNAVIAGLAGAKFIDAESEQSDEVLATPRRLAVLVRGVAAMQADQELERKGPYVSQALDAGGKPSQAVLGFARSCGVDIDKLEKGKDAKGEHFVFRSVKRGEPLDEHLADIVTQALKKLPTPKIMRWGDRDVQFVRPVHGLMLLHGDRVVRGEVLGIAGSNSTHGHRFMGEGAVTVPNAEAYAETLAQRGAVIAGFRERRRMIADALAGEAARQKAVLNEDEALLDEVTALVEFPAVYSGAFEPDFLAVPQECLILSMKQHQKYFPLFDAGGTLLPRFLIVSNLKTADPSDIVRGNERVLRARLSDAKFFFDKDRVLKLADRVPRLAGVVYHNKLGSQLERIGRIQKLAGHIAEKLGADVAAAERAAWLCKADLLTDMVGEFPELQGLMGMYYARHDGEPESVARAIEAHYHPRFANDTLPEDNAGAAVALADKLDTLTGIFGIGLAPTGDKDPFALRRHALGVLRILAESQLPLDLLQLLQFARSQFPGETVAESVAADLHAFMLDRLRGYLRERGFAADEVDAVVSQGPRRIDLVLPRLEAVRAFRRMPEAESLAAANKRIRNILRKADGARGEPDVALLQEPAEKKLFGAVNTLIPKVDSLVENEAYTDALKLLAGVKGEVDAFFDEVMVMTEDPLTRDNRLALLARLEQMMNRVADISRLAP
jgi:glycyl-tRNA synthetase beta chain